MLSLAFLLLFPRELSISPKGGKPTESGKSRHFSGALTGDAALRNTFDLNSFHHYSSVAVWFRGKGREKKRGLATKHSEGWKKEIEETSFPLSPPSLFFAFLPSRREAAQ